MKTATISILYIIGLLGSALVMWLAPFLANVESPDIHEYGIIGVILAIAAREFYRLKDARKIESIEAEFKVIRATKVSAIDGDFENIHAHRLKSMEDYIHELQTAMAIRNALDKERAKNNRDEDDATA